MKAKRTHYMVLGLPPSSTKDELHARYKEIALKLHPDKGGNEMEFVELTLAWGVLKNDAERRRYDLRLKLDKGNCVRCDGQGTVEKMAGFTAKIKLPCPQCEGTGRKPCEV